ncbi:MAG TPA: hypothetical protein DCX54_03155, partial [Flavobacteriales bacterium]|nr:hypothetical protein [Flavobacteriales bacterium]
LDGNLVKIADGCGGKCEGEAMLVALGGTPPYNYVWNSTPPQTGSSAIDLCAGTVVVTLTDNNDCIFNDSIAIAPPPALVIDSVVVKNTSCFTNTDGEASIYLSGGISPYNYLWSNLQTTQTITGLGNGLLSIEITDQNNCMITDTVSVAVQDTVLVNAFVDSFACVGDIIQLNAVGYGATQFIWEEDSAGFRIPIGTGDSISYLIEDSVLIVLRGQNDILPPCFDYDSVYVIGIPAPPIDAGPNVTIQQGDFTQLLASPFLFNGSYAWIPASSINDSTVIDPIARPTVTTIYTVIGTNEYGCSASDDVTVTVVDNDLIINGFSPNGDGVNDTWELPFLKDYPNVVVTVYNRWGIEVFSSTGYRSAWDGTYESELLPSASYYYVIDLYGDGEDVKTGAVSILY